MTRNHSDFIHSYIDSLTPKGEAPERFHFWTAVSTIGGALRRRVYIDQGHYRYYPNFYVVLVGPPGLIKKSTTINVGSSLLRDVPNVIIGADCSTWQSFVEEVAQAQDMFAEGANVADIMEQDYTVTCALTLAISEFGTFFDPDDRQMVNVLTELFDAKVGAAFRKRTKTQGEDNLMNPFVNILTGTTPDWIKDNFKGRFGGWGLSSRMIFLHCDEKERHIAFPDELWRGEYAQTMKSFLHDLTEISTLQGVMQIAPSARVFYKQWYEEHGIRQTALNRHTYHDPWLAYYLARKADHVLKLALVLSISRSSSLEISLEDLTEAVRRCDEIEIELSKVFSTKSAESREVRLNDDVWNGLCRIIAHNGRIEEFNFFAFTTRYMAGGKANELLKQLTASKWLQRVQDDGVVWLEFTEHTQISETVRREIEARRAADSTAEAHD